DASNSHQVGSSPRQQSSNRRHSRMQPRALWPDDPIFIEIGCHDASIALGLRAARYTRYLGVGSNPRRIARLQATHAAVAEQLVASPRRKVVLQNNADVLILSGRRLLSLWRFRWVRHAEHVAWQAGLGPLSLLALFACLCHVIAGRIARPKLVALKTPRG